MNPEVAQARKILVKILLIIAVIAAIFFLFVFLKNGKLALSLDDNENTNTVKIINQETGSEYSIDSFKGSEFSKSVSPGNYEVRVFNGKDQSSVYFLNIGRFRQTTTQEVKFKNQNSRVKLSRDVDSCPLLIGKNLYSHNCYSLSAMYSHTSLTKDNYPEKTEDLSYVYGEGGVQSTKPYKDGNLVLQTDVSSLDEKNRVSFINPDGSKNAIVLPDEFKTTTNNLSIIVDTAGGDGFAVVDNSLGKLAYYTNNKSESQVIVFENDLKTPQEIVQTWVDIRAGKIATISGIPVSQVDSTVDDPKNEKYYNNPEDMDIRIYDTKNGNSQTKIRLEGGIGSASLCEDDVVCIHESDKLTLYKVDGDELDKLTIINGVTNFQPTPETGLVYTQDNKLYSYDYKNNSSHEIYSSSKFETSTISSTKDGLLVNAILKNDTTQKGAHTFFVSNQENKDNNFIDNVLPYRSKDLGYIRDSDFFKDLVVVDVYLDSWTSDVGLENFTYNQQEFNRKQDEVLKDLKSKGITSKDYTIVIKP